MFWGCDRGEELFTKAKDISYSQAANNFGSFIQKLWIIITPEQHTLLTVGNS
ncbi:hypothetical protein [Funiculus sociatus]|uniref:hypothetical protein n=1 Tax=Funiculus sociatus TaxID=450527 RepID=UPI0016871D20|nr:hypothetical protein [Trichocoleus sp. FACHB-69]